MIFHSIKWRLQLWYGMILVAVLMGFGVTAYQLEHGRMMGRIDGELHRRAGTLGDALRPHPRGPQPRGENLPPDGNLPGPEGMDGDRPPEQLPQGPPQSFHPSPRVSALFDESDTNGYYYILTARNGHEIARSANAPKFDRSLPTPDTTQPGGGRELPPQMHGSFREVQVVTPPGDMILAGCNIAPELAELKGIAIKLAGVGGGILLLGLAGGWWFVGRALRPVSEISATAGKIAAGDLSQRINVAETESELGGLATVLNSTFARLEATFAQQRRFTSDAAHELRTPVSVILTQVQSTLNRERTPAEYRETLEACQRAAQRMRRLITSLLELARFDAGQEPLKRQKFDLAHTVRDSADLVQPLAQERDVKITCDLAPLECSGDSERLGQVVTNLLTNAIQHNPPGIEVRLKLEARGNVAMLTVADNGSGIPVDDLPRVFERFYQADKSRTSGGSGLGLAISRAVVEAHGGTMEVASLEGAGTTFTIRLPVG